MSWYCDAAPGHPLHGPRTMSTNTGFRDPKNRSFSSACAWKSCKRACPWELVLRKRAALQRAFGGFDVDTVAAYGTAEVERLLDDAAIIRNRRKIAAIIENARRVAAMRGTHGGFAAWLVAHHPRAKSEWVKLFKKTLTFTGGEVTGEFLLSLGYLPGAHRRDCPVYDRVAECNPPWMSVAPEVYRE